MKLWKLAVGVACGMVFVACSAWADETTDRMRSELATRHFDAAYAIAQQHSDRLGDAEFDLLFGVAAIETGHAGEGVLALERYRMTYPQDADAVLYLSRGYLLLGESARARVELDALLGSGDLPAGATDAAKVLLETARLQEASALGSGKVYVEAGAGIDSNVNGGSGSSIVTLPIFGQIVLPAGVTKTGDTFTQLAAGVSGTRTLKPGLSIFGGIDVNTRLHSTDTAYDQQNLGGNLGVTLNRGGTLWRATASHNTLILESDRYRSVTGLAGEWATGIYPGGMLNAFVQYARFEYGAAGAGQRDSDFYGVGAGYRRILSGAMHPALSVSLTLGDDRNDCNRPDYSRHLWGVSGTFSITPRPRLTLSANLMHQESDYRADDPLLLVARDDRFDALTLSATYLIDRRLSLLGEIGYADNRSSIPLYSYDRLQSAVKLRYEF